MKVQSTNFTCLTYRSDFLVLNGEVVNLGHYYQASYNNIQARLAQLEQSGGMSSMSSVTHSFGTQGQLVAGLQALESCISALEAVASPTQVPTQASHGILLSLQMAVLAVRKAALILCRCLMH
mmetsp:Transcript_22921/g.34756  ORF Transcript_22921/g.34756 Transcript_22921/m.34756 type:complete len:123 (+) Transcript_22921:387-755(+)